jgi:hypothetical protein
MWVEVRWEQCGGGDLRCVESTSYERGVEGKGTGKRWGNGRESMLERDVPVRCAEALGRIGGARPRRHFSTFAYPPTRAPQSTLRDK